MIGWKGGLDERSEPRSTQNKGKQMDSYTWKVVIMVMNNDGDRLTQGILVIVNRVLSGEGWAFSVSLFRGENTVETIQLCKSLVRSLSIALDTVFPHWLVDQDWSPFICRHFNLIPNLRKRSLSCRQLLMKKLHSALHLPQWSVHWKYLLSLENTYLYIIIQF